MFFAFGARLAPVNDQNIFNFDEVEADERRSRLIPWIVIGVIAVIAILISLIVINTMGPSDDPQPTTPVETTEPEPTTEPTPGPTTTPAPEPTQEPEETQPPRDSHPDDQIDTSGVVVGSTSTVEVPYDGWQVTIDVSNKFAPWSYRLEGADNGILLLDSELIDKLPASCESLKSQWGVERTADGKFEAHSPQQVCEENESLYTEILGLVRAIPDTIKPIG